MADILHIASRIFPIIILIISGNLFRHFKFIKSDTVEDMKKLVVNIALPAVLFLVFSDTEFEVKYFAIATVIFIVCLIMLFAGKLFQRLLKVDNRYYPALFAGFEAGMMGYSIFSAVYGTDSLYKFAVADLGQVVFVFFILTAFLKKADGAHFKKSDVAISFFKSPVIIAIIAGIISGRFGIISFAEKSAVIGALLETLDVLSRLTMPLICIIIGYELKIDFKNIILPLKTALLRIVVLFGIAAIVNVVLIRSILGLDRMFEVAVYTMFILPPPFIIPIFAKGSDEDRRLSVNTISVNILLSLVSYILIISFIHA